MMGSHAVYTEHASPKAYFSKPITAEDDYRASANTTKAKEVVMSVPQATPITDFAEALGAQGITEVEALYGVEREGYLEIWVIVDDANRETRRIIHDTEWDLMMRYLDKDIQFELLRRQGRDLRSLVTFPSVATFISPRGMNAYRSRAHSAGQPQQSASVSHYTRVP